MSRTITDMITPEYKAVLKASKHWLRLPTRVGNGNMSTCPDVDMLAALVLAQRAEAVEQAHQYPIFVVSAVIIRDGSILLERRAPSGVPDKDNRWDLPGGKVEFGEEPADALVREIREELNVVVVVKRLVPAVRRSVWRYPNGKKAHWLLSVYVCEIVSGKPPCNKNLLWIPLTELTAENTMQPDLDLIREAQARLEIEREARIKALEWMWNKNGDDLREEIARLRAEGRKNG